MFSRLIDKQHSSLFEHISLVLGAVLLFGMLFSSFFITTEFQHDCTGEDCPICQMVALCDNFVNQLGTGLILLSAAILIIFIKSCDSFDFDTAFIAPTPVKQKVRLNN